MTTSRIMLLAVLVISMIAAGCAVSTTSIRQKDGTVRTTRHLVWLPSLQFRTFTSDEDYMIAWEIHGVQYVFPKGTGTWESLDQISFRGDTIRCKVLKRELFVDDRSVGKFEPGDCVRITGDGRVLVNEKERPSTGTDSWDAPRDCPR
jgi:hypothetical protein